jgi:adenylate kinase family enzyme
VPQTDQVGRARRILVYGVTGSGKSTLALTLGELTGIPATSVDDIAWSPGWVPMPTDEQIAYFDALTQGDEWLLDSAYGTWRDLVVERADLVVALDYPRLVSLGRLLRRTAARVVDQREVCNGNHERVRGLFARDSIVLWHFTSFRRKRAEIRRLASAISGPPVIRLRRPADARALVEAEAARRRTARRADADPSS